MPLTFYAIFEAAVIASSLSIDAFTAGFAYGSKKIEIPFSSIQIINIICTTITGLSFVAGTAVASHIPSWITFAMAFIILFIIGFVKLLDSITKSIIRKHNDISKQFKISLFNFKFILSLYANPECADIDESKTISSKEAAALALSLSLDGMAIGLSAAIMRVNGPALFVFSLFSNTIALILGCYTGGKIAEKTPFNISWVSGAALILLAFSKIL